ncbi:Ig-like protein group 2 [Herbinix hemicellulosilytica]|uniref:BIG2 domain-containing protein n=1 Tax=Herbinix hemicellulosilytica TaxID=1564487 RepID=A0A0H5SHC6_HERHM|nr:Ig-like domain-containing protein [Herbinix hemicellulosilytica]RBP59389.1 Ig-like protein group 2 [Herbinix hemicellulosilytica]CRZ34889.1 hypothetical protein HHT355_1689 [Herbinix hemicellulosilytica]
MPRFKKILYLLVLCFLFTLLTFIAPNKHAQASKLFSFVILSSYNKTVNIGDEFYLVAVTSNGKMPKWSSSSSKIASVNTYGKVTAKKEGTATITAKIDKAEASCKVTVKKTEITISDTYIIIERGETYNLSATTSNNKHVNWTSSHKSIAVVDDKGNVTGLKPGETTVTATVDGSKATCKVKVKYPTVTLDKKKVTLYRGQSIKLNAHVSSGAEPKWKSNKKSVAIVNPDGTVTAIKNGTAIITATVDGVSQTCEVIVKKPEIKISASELTIKAGQKVLLSAYVSSGNYPEWSTSNPNVATVDSLGWVTGVKKGKAYIYVKEDGTKVKCTVYVTD